MSTNQNTAAANSNNAGRAYNLKVTPSAVEVKTDSRGKEFIRASVALKIRGRDATRTLIAQGKAMDAIQNVLVVGEEASIRCLFSNYMNDEGEKGGEYLSAVGLPMSKEELDARKAA